MNTSSQSINLMLQPCGVSMLEEGSVPLPEAANLSLSLN